MDAIQNVRHDLVDDRFRTAARLGVASIPFTIALNAVLSSDAVVATPLLVACVISGYYYRSRSMNGTRAGAVTAVPGGLPLLVWAGGTRALEWFRNPLFAEVVADSRAMVAIWIGVFVGYLVVLALVAVLLGRTGGTVGEWVYRLDIPRRSNTDA